MSRRIGKVVIIEPEPDGKCELCGAVSELRPYGPNGERICYDCGMKDEAATNSVMNRVLFGHEEDRKPNALLSSAKTAACMCPNCGHELSGVTEARFTDSDRSPGPLRLKGNPTLCCYCGALLIFADNQGHVRAMTEAERNSVKFAPIVEELLDHFRERAKAGVGDFTKRRFN